jgi:hypothetical protein
VNAGEEMNEEIAGVYQFCRLDSFAIIRRLSTSVTFKRKTSAATVGPAASIVGALKRRQMARPAGCETRDASAPRAPIRLGGYVRFTGYGVFLSCF